MVDATLASVDLVLLGMVALLSIVGRLLGIRNDRFSQISDRLSASSDISTSPNNGAGGNAGSRRSKSPRTP